jgi:uncharacterized membrane protein (DUF2068 family)
LLIALGIVWLSGVTAGGSLAVAADWLGALDGHHLVRHIVARLASLNGRELHQLAAATFGYAALFLVEGVGLILRKHWAEWMTVIVTGSFVPFEVYSLLRRPGPGKVVALALNVAIVVYLARRIAVDRARRRDERGGAAPHAPGRVDGIVP